MEGKKKCFIITPIGDDGTTIRRHIDGVIDAAIIPVLENEYSITVAHRVSAPGSINKQVIRSIYDSDLVIANLTNLNPNVMYELAFRHSLRKPVITIMEKNNNKLPFDVVTERTIFYTNDIQGVIELKAELKKYINKWDEKYEEKFSNPIYDALEGLEVEKEIIENIRGKTKLDESSSKYNEANAMEYIINKLNDIEGKIATNTNITLGTTPKWTRACRFEFEGIIESNGLTDKELKILITDIYKIGGIKDKIQTFYVDNVTVDNGNINVVIRCIESAYANEIYERLKLEIIAIVKSIYLRRE